MSEAEAEAATEAADAAEVDEAAKKRRDHARMREEHQNVVVQPLLTGKSEYTGSSPAGINVTNIFLPF
jgi:hypothetical protein